ncbi:excisionase family DNA binding protein [Nocardia tenerifensis]|uniref:Excisionase family DNA binding protein n=1 Tax=Nocardia tenerifensis TaxID=228006 RepID=A0A318JN42_9NOCA|nr:helix-turn-helix domain-containing protein [Nocardia tenerifensis]PXX52297.1 excisionase family DNA binding protein [Nocardia tenerifensis]
MSLPDPAELITLRAAAALLRVSHPTIRRWISQRRLSEYRVGASPRVDRREVRGLIVLVSPRQEMQR